MDDLDNKNVKVCWSKIKSAKGVDLFVDNFYQLMFEHHPETRRLFPKNIKDQKTSLLGTLDNVINGIEYIDELDKELVSLGERHKNMGIKKEMFNSFISTIVTAADIASNSTLTKMELSAWEKAFRKISDIMLKAY